MLPCFQLFGVDFCLRSAATQEQEQKKRVRAPKKPNRRGPLLSPPWNLEKPFSISYLHQNPYHHIHRRGKTQSNKMSGHGPPAPRRNSSMYRRNNPSTTIKKSLSTQSENGTTSTGATNGYPLKSPSPTPS